MKSKKIIMNRFNMYYVKEMVFISPCRKSLIKLCVYAAIFGLSLLIFWIPHVIISHRYFWDANQLNRFPTDLKYILIWKPSHSLKIKLPFQQKKLPEGQDIFIKQKCQYINCYITYDKDLLNDKHQNLDAVVFNVRDIIKYPPEEFYLRRSADQKYIFHSLDSSEKYPICNSFFDNFFNWTWTYKLSSDISQPFISIYDNKSALIGPKRHMNWISRMVHNERYYRNGFNKTNAVAWIASRCKTKVKYRDFINELIDELKGYKYTLDIYGPCGNKKCPKSNIEKCHKMIENKYFFQLILEDSLSEDYVSEIIIQVLSHRVIPIILGLSDYNSFLPPGSYINAQSFDMKKIGAIIDYLIKFPMSYYRFFDWKNHYHYTKRPRSNICNLCTKLNVINSSGTPMIYEDFRSWWNPDYRDACKQLGVKNMFDTN